jgi:hypothetical protein
MWCTTTAKNEEEKRNQGWGGSATREVQEPLTVQGSVIGILQGSLTQGQADQSKPGTEGPARGGAAELRVHDQVQA